MIYILSRTTKKHQKTLSRLLHSQLKKIQGLPLKFKDFPRPCKPWNGSGHYMKSYMTNIPSKITIIFSMILSERHGDLYGRAGDPRCHIWESWPVCVNDRK